MDVRESTDMESRVGFLPRGLAYVLDVAALWTLAAAVQRPLAALFPGSVTAMVAQVNAHPDASHMGPMVEWVARMAVAATLLAPLYGLIEGLLGRSPGKLVLGLRIASPTGEKPPLLTLLIRYCIKGGATITGLLSMLFALSSLNVLAQAMGSATSVGCLLVLSRERTAIHDRVAGTVVLRGPQPRKLLA
jgi:uncharacterized RDD family membrane protein YckC